MIMKFKIVWVLVMMLSLHGYSREKYGDVFITIEQPKLIRNIRV